MPTVSDPVEVFHTPSPSLRSGDMTSRRGFGGSAVVSIAL